MNVCLVRVLVGALAGRVGLGAIVGIFDFDVAC